MDVSVIIPTLNGGPRFREVLEALRRQHLMAEWVVIDSGSRDGTVEAARDAGCRVLEIAPGEFDHGATRDRAIRAAEGEYVALLVQDAVPQGAEWLEELVAPLRDDPRVAGTFSRQVPIPGGNPVLAARLAWWIAGRSEPHRGELADGERWEDLSPHQRLERVAFDNVSSCLRRERWQERSFGRCPFGEDLSWSTWAVRSGHAIQFVPGAVVEHSHDRSAWAEARRIYCDHRNLHALPGLCTVPALWPAWRGRHETARHYLDLLEAAGLAPEEHARRRRWVRRYVAGEVLAQWLAPRVNRAGARGLYGWLDRRIRRGI